MTPPRLLRSTLFFALALHGCGHTASSSSSSTASPRTTDVAVAEGGAAHVAVVVSLGPNEADWLAQLGGVTSGGRWPQLAADGVTTLADAHALLGHFEEADGLYAALERAEVAADVPATIRVATSMARASNAYDRGAYADAMAACAAICDAEAHVGDEDEGLAEQVAMACGLVSWIGSEAGDVSVLARIPSLPEDAEGAARRVRKRAVVFARLGRIEEAEAELRRVVPAFDPASTEDRTDLETYGLVQFARGRFDAALEAHTRQLEADRRTARRSGEPFSPRVESDDVARLVRAGLAARRPELVCGQARATLAHVQAEHGDRHPSAGWMHLRLAQCAELTGDRAATEAETSRALASFATSAMTHLGRIETEALAARLGVR